MHFNFKPSDVKSVPMNKNKLIYILYGLRVSE